MRNCFQRIVFQFKSLMNESFWNCPWFVLSWVWSENLMSNYLHEFLFIRATCEHCPPAPWMDVSTHPKLLLIFINFLQNSLIHGNDQISILGLKITKRWYIIKTWFYNPSKSTLVKVMKWWYRLTLTSSSKLTLSPPSVVPTACPLITVRVLERSPR